MNTCAQLAQSRVDSRYLANDVDEVFRPSGNDFQSRIHYFNSGGLSTRLPTIYVPFLGQNQARKIYEGKSEGVGSNNMVDSMDSARPNRWDITLESGLLLQRPLSDTNHVPLEPIRVAFCDLGEGDKGASSDILDLIKKTLDSTHQLSEEIIEKHQSITENVAGIGDSSRGRGSSQSQPKSRHVLGSNCLDKGFSGIFNRGRSSLPNPTLRFSQSPVTRDRGTGKQFQLQEQLSAVLLSADYSMHGECAFDIGGAASIHSGNHTLKSESVQRLPMFLGLPTDMP